MDAQSRPTLIQISISGCTASFTLVEGKPWLKLRDLHSIMGYKKLQTGAVVRIFKQNGYDLHQFAIRVPDGRNAALFLNEDGLRLVIELCPPVRTLQLRQWVEQGGLQSVTEPIHVGMPTQPLAADSARIQSPQEYYRYPLPADFTEASRQFSTQLHDVVKRTHQAGTVLRLMQHYFANSKQDGGLMEDDFAQVVDLLIGTLPHHYTDINDPFDDFDSSARQVVRNGCAREGKAQAILEAMTIAARGDSAPEDLSKAAGKVLDIANADPAYEPDWQTFTDVIESRGYTVRTSEHRGVRMIPLVLTPEMAKQMRKQDRAVANLVATVNQSTAASREVPAGKGCRP